VWTRPRFSFPMSRWPCSGFLAISAFTIGPSTTQQPEMAPSGFFKMSYLSFAYSALACR
jgi:hypothetical protein